MSNMAVPTTQAEMLASGYNSGDPARKAAALAAGYTPPMSAPLVTPTPPATAPTTATPPAYDKMSGLLTDYGRSQNLPEVNTAKAGASGINPTTSTTPAPTPEDQKLIALGITPEQIKQLNDPKGLDPASFQSLVDQVETKLKTNNDLTTVRANLIKHLYDSPLTPEELAKLPEDIQQVVKTGGKDAIELQIRLLNDQIAGRANSLSQSIHTLTEGYQTSVTAAEKAKQDAISTVLDYSKTTGMKPSDIIKALYPDIYNKMPADQATALDAISAPVSTKIIGSAASGYYQVNADGSTNQIVPPGGGAAGVDPAALTGMINYYQTTGLVPAMGNASTGLRAAFWAAVGGGGQDLTTNAATNKAALSAATTALRTQTNQLAAATTGITTMDKQLDLLKQYSDKVDRSGSPLINKYALYLKGQIGGDVDTQAMQNIVQSASYEFAKILSGSSASIAGVSVTSAEDAKNLLNANMSKDQINAIVGLMKQEADFRLSSQKDSISQIQDSIKSLNNPTASSPSSGSVTDPGVGGDSTIPSDIEAKVNSNITLSTDGKTATIPRAVWSTLGQYMDAVLADAAAHGVTLLVK